MVIYGKSTAKSSFGTAGANAMWEYKSAKDMYNKTSLSLEIPEFLLNEPDNEFVGYMDGSVGIIGKRFEFHAGKLIGLNVNIAGVSGELTFNKIYECTNSNGVKYLKYQIGNGFTAISWFTDDMMYGLRLLDYDGVNGMDALIKSIGVDPNNLVEMPETTDSKIDNTHELYQFDSLGVSIELPKYNDKLLTVVESIKNGDENDKVSFILDGSMVLIIEQTATSAIEESAAVEFVELGSYTIEYFKSNPFDEGTDQFKYYETLVSEMNSIAESFKVLS